MSASSLVLTVALMAAQVPSPSVPLSPATAPHEPLVAPRASGERRVLGFTVAGTAAMVVGAGLWGVMVQGLVSGAGDTRDHAAIAAEVNEAPRMPTADERWWLDYHARFGRASNVQAVACGVLAGGVHGHGGGAARAGCGAATQGAGPSAGVDAWGGRGLAPAVLSYFSSSAVLVSSRASCHTPSPLRRQILR
jgi:hypothetical protein